MYTGLITAFGSAVLGAVWGGVCSKYDAKVRVEQKRTEQKPMRNTLQISKRKLKNSTKKISKYSLITKSPQT